MHFLGAISIALLHKHKSKFIENFSSYRFGFFFSVLSICQVAVDSFL